MKSLHVFSKADMTKGHGVLSAYQEQLGLIRKYLKEDYDIRVNPGRLGDINHYHTINPGFFLRHKLGKKGVAVGYVHFLPVTIDESIRMPKLFRKIFYWYTLKFYKSMDKLVVVNPYFIDLMEDCGIDTSNTVYIPNFVSNDEFYEYDLDKKAGLRKEYGLCDQDFLVLGVGQLQTRKGIFDFVEVAKRLPDIKFIWAGGFSFGRSSDGYHEIKKIMENPQDNLEFLGIVERDQMKDLYNMADVMFLPSLTELFPMTILEAMATRTPILLRDIDIYKLILDGYYLSSRDVTGFVAEIRRLKNDCEYREMAKEMASKGNDFYNEESVARMWEDFYASL